MINRAKRGFFYSVLFILLVLSLIIVNTISPGRSRVLEYQMDSGDISSPSTEHLEGTCPRGRVCTRPTCSLWSDIDYDGICDRS